eukprot:364582-Chlamydomonas_euryale.AAC.9
MAGMDAAARRQQLKSMKEEVDAELEKLDMVAALKQLASESLAHAAVQKDMVQELKQLTSDSKTQATLQTNMTEVLKGMHALMLSAKLENAKQAKCKRLQTAWLHAEAGAFKFQGQNVFRQEYITSTAYVREVLKTFMQGNGHFITNEDVHVCDAGAEGSGGLPDGSSQPDPRTDRQQAKAGTARQSRHDEVDNLLWRIGAKSVISSVLQDPVLYLGMVAALEALTPKAGGHFHARSLKGCSLVAVSRMSWPYAETCSSSLPVVE